jgi:hypothetical protein
MIMAIRSPRPPRSPVATTHSSRCPTIPSSDSLGSASAFSIRGYSLRSIGPCLTRVAAARDGWPCATAPDGSAASGASADGIVAPGTDLGCRSWWWPRICWTPHRLPSFSHGAETVHVAQSRTAESTSAARAPIGTSRSVLASLLDACSRPRCRHGTPSYVHTTPTREHTTPTRVHMTPADVHATPRPLPGTLAFFLTSPSQENPRSLVEVATLCDRRGTLAKAPIR